MDTDNTERTPETAEDQPKQETPASGQGVITASSRGDLIRKTRMSRKEPLSCTQLAGLIGVSTATMSLIERDKCPVNDVRLAKIAKVLSLPLDILQKEKGAEVSSLTDWQHYLKEMYNLDYEELATLLQIAIDAKLYRYDAPDTRSLDQWERFYEEMRNFLPRVTFQERMLQKRTVLKLIGQRGNEPAEEVLNRYLAEIDALVEPVIRNMGYDFANPPNQPFNDLYLAAICKAYRIKTITIQDTTNTDIVKQQLFSLNIPEAIGSFIALSENPNMYAAAHTVDNAPDGIRRHLILHDRRNVKAIDSVHRLWRATTEIVLGPERMNQISSFAEIAPDVFNWLLLISTLRVEFPPSALTRLIETKMSPLAKENPFLWMEDLQSIYGPGLPESRVFGELTRQMPFPLCHFCVSLLNQHHSEAAASVLYSYASPSAAEKGMVIPEGIIIQSHKFLFKEVYLNVSESLVDRTVTLDNSLVTDFRLSESFIGTSVRIVAQTGPTSNSIRVFFLPDFTNTPTKDPYADW